jgi:thioredoxin reductase
MMNRSPLDVAIIGAGPYGLSIAAHLQAAQIDYRIFGSPMAFWRQHMPPGMHLKSYGDSSSLFDADSSFSIEDFTRANGIEYHPSRHPVALSTFIEYGQTFQERFVPQVTRARLVSQHATADGHELSFDNGESLFARTVVVATGVLAFKHTPALLARLPTELASHSSDYGSMEALRGKRVAVVGGGSSALDLTGLLSAQGCEVTLVARASSLAFQHIPVQEERSLLQRLVAPTAHGLGAGWILYGCTVPRLFRLLPDRLRSTIVDNTLGPSGGYFIRERVETAARLKLGRVIESACEQAGAAHLSTIDRHGMRETLVADHVVAATGYKVDVGRLAFLAEDTRRKVRTVGGAPLLSASYESSVPGLHFVGLASARCFGPIMRFVVGAIHPAQSLCRALPGRLARRLVWLSSPAAEEDQTPVG